MKPALLVSIHDVSAATVDVSRRIVDRVDALGVPLRALTLLVIPKHDDDEPLDACLPTCRWLRELADAGACLCLHGLTHRMSGRARHPWQWLWARGFARGQGEFYLSDDGDSRARIDAARAIVERCGLSDAVHGFVPPAWLLSPAAQRVVENAGFAFYERLAGIRAGDATRARRLIGFGSLSALESCASSVHAWVQSQRRAVDTRLAIHPADAECARSWQAIERTLGRLLPRTQALNYTEFLARSA